MSPLVSIITPTYNHERFISECIESVIAQIYTNWEMIIIDDGSTDSTYKIAESFAQNDSRIKLIHQDNVGIFRLSITYNKALEISEGEYIAILEGDDYWEPNKLEVQIKEFLNKRNSVLCWSQIYKPKSLNNTDFEILPVLNTKEYKYYNNDPVGSIYNIFIFRDCIPALTILIKRDALINIGGFKQNYGLPLVDLPTLYELALLGRFIFIPIPLGTWRIYPTQITKTYPVEIIQGIKYLAIDNFNMVKETNLIEKRITTSRILNYYKKQIIISYSRSGRYKLIRKDFKNARMDYINAIRAYGFKEPIWKLRALIGLIFSFFNGDVEKMAGFFGKGGLK